MSIGLKSFLYVLLSALALSVVLLLMRFYPEVVLGIIGIIGFLVVWLVIYENMRENE